LWWASGPVRTSGDADQAAAAAELDDATAGQPVGVVLALQVLGQHEAAVPQRAPHRAGRRDWGKGQSIYQTKGVTSTSALPNGDGAASDLPVESGVVALLVRLPLPTPRPQLLHRIALFIQQIINHNKRREEKK